MFGAHLFGAKCRCILGQLTQPGEQLCPAAAAARDKPTGKSWENGAKPMEIMGK